MTKITGLDHTTEIQRDAKAHTLNCWVQNRNSESLKHMKAWIPNVNDHLDSYTYHLLFSVW